MQVSGSFDESQLRRRNAELIAACHPLPGSTPYDNVRPINIPGRFEGSTLFDCVCQMYPQVGDDQWRRWFREGLIRDGSAAVSGDQFIRGGQQYWHIFPGTVEPTVSTDIELLYEDDALVALRKPAPLPMHPCGRYNFNTLISLLDRVYRPHPLRIVHRLDANTTGVIVLAKSPSVATAIRYQFQRNEVTKQYLVRCHGTPEVDSFCCRLPIARQRGVGGTRDIDENGNPAQTDFSVLRHLKDGTSLIEARPMTGRTHQIRLHLWAMGLPVLNDPSYLPRQRKQAPCAAADQASLMCLHASEMSLRHPVTKQPLRFAATPPSWATSV